MSKKISDYFTKISTGSELKEAKVKLESGIDEAKSIEHFATENEDKIYKNVKTEAEQQLLVILPQQKVEKLPIPIKIEKIEPLFQCQDFKEVFTKANLLKKHKAIHNKMFQCKICDKNYPINARLKKHVKNIHENPGSFKCQICNLKFNTKTNLNAHQRIHNSDRPKPFKCGKCDYSTDIKASYQGHLKTHDRIIERCEKCGCLLQKNRTHDCSLDCKLCGKKFSHKSAILKHFMNVHANETDKKYFECDICGLKLNRKKLFILHMEVKHADGKPQTFTCDLDGKTFKSKEKIVQHMKSHLPLVKCDICYIKVNVRNLKGHMKNVHAGIKKKKPTIKVPSKNEKFHCQICFRIFTDKSSLKVHAKIHDKKFKCKICEKPFISNGMLSNHVRDFHEHPRSYACDLCDKKFNQRGDLRTHKILHENRPKRFKCPQCDYASDRLDNFKKHLNFHEKTKAKLAIENPHKCPKCPSSFKDKPNWYAHMYRVHPKALVECDICGIKMKQRLHLLRHIKTVHKNGF